MNRENAILVSLSLSCWPGHRLDRQATEETETNHGARRGVGRFTKALLPGAAELETVQKLSSSLRNDHAARTLPWGDDGWRVIPSAGYMAYAADIRAYRSKWDTAVAEFLAAYPRLMEDARAALGTLWSVADYPSLPALEQKFELRHRVHAIPDAADIRVDGASAEELARLRAEAEADVQAGLRAAQGEVKRRIAECLQKLVERLSQPKAVFRDSLIENARELAAIVPRLLLEPDPAIEAAAAELFRLGQCDPDTLRANQSDRRRAADAAAAAAKLLGDMQALAAPVEVGA